MVVTVLFSVVMEEFNDADVVLKEEFRVLRSVATELLNVVIVP